MMHRLFIDETGNSDLRNAPHDPNVQYLSLTGLLTSHAAHETIIQPRVDAHKAKLLGHTPENPVILHRRDIMDRAGAFVVLHDEKIRSEFDQMVLGLIQWLPYIAMTVVIDKATHIERYSVWHFDPYHYCMRCLIERYILWLNRHDQIGDVVAEPRTKLVDKKLKASFQRIWQDGTEHIPAHRVQQRLTSRELKFFPKMQNCAGLQICDLIAHPSARAMRLLRAGTDAPNDFGSKVAKILEDKKLARDPKTFEIDGWGRKWLP